VILEEPHGAKSEPFRVLRTNLDFVNLERHAKTIMVTSAVAGEGKSTTAANLAIALTQTGRDVVLVDLDLRQPFIDRFFDLNGQPGLTSVALGTARLEAALAQIVHRSMPRRGSSEDDDHATGSLEFLRAGLIPPNPGEFVSSKTVAEILERLRDRADIVLIDAPPLVGIGDALALSAKVDALILVTRLNLLKRPLLNELDRLLASTPAHALGFVVTEAESEQGYGYGYGSHHYKLKATSVPDEFATVAAKNT
jgi:Mrp family chromosome partitioning ATPase